MKKILLIIPQATSFNTFLRELVIGLKKKRFKVYAVFHDKNLDGINCYKNDYPCEFFNIVFPRGMALVSHFKARKTLRKLVDDLQPDIIHAHFSSAIFTTALSKKKVWPLVFGTAHGLVFPLANSFLRRIAGIAEVWSCRQMERMLVLTNDDVASLSKYMDKDRIVKLPCEGMGCCTDTFNIDNYSDSFKKDLKRKLGIDEGDFVFSFIGRRTHFKGFGIVAKSFLRYLRINDKAKLLLLGVVDSTHPTGLDKSEEKALLECDNVIDLGWRSDVSDYLSIVDVNVFPSIREGLPVNIMESLSMGVPVITFNSRGCSDLVKHNHNGLVVEQGDNDGIYLAMKEIVEKDFLRSKFVKNSLLEREKYNRERFVEEQINFYDSVMVEAF